MVAFLSISAALARPQANELGVCGYRAVLFAVDDYEDPKIPDLDTPRHDIETIGAVLRNSYGFDVEDHINPSRAAILRALDELRASVAECDAVVVYFAGHGEFDPAAKEGYWLPADAARDTKDKWISNADIASHVNALAARHVLLFADSCFAGSLFQTRGLDVLSAGPSPDLAAAEKLSTNRSRWVITSGGNEPVADQYRDGVSVFAYFLRQSLVDNSSTYATSDALFPALRDMVSVNAHQTPVQGAFNGAGHEGGQLVFVRQAGATAAEGAGPSLAVRAQRAGNKPNWIRVPAIIAGAVTAGAGALTLNNASRAEQRWSTQLSPAGQQEWHDNLAPLRTGGVAMIIAGGGFVAGASLSFAF